VESLVSFSSFRFDKRSWTLSRNYFSNRVE
jgi:hypothetical protein